MPLAGLGYKNGYIVPQVRHLIMSSTAGPLGASSYSRQIALNVAIASRLQGLGYGLFGLDMMPYLT